MTQNTSHAVMAQRVEPHTSLDDFPTPPWATRALCEHVLGIAPGGAADRVVWEPACNRGFMARPLAEYFGTVYPTDIFDYGYEKQAQRADFLLDAAPILGLTDIITNPPFRLAAQFIERALHYVPNGVVAVIVRTSFLEGCGRYNNLFSLRPPSIIAQFAERVPMVKGRYDHTASTATSYAWLVWGTGEGTKFKWIPPCRPSLFKEDDPA
jgi:hypothetical protein